MKILTEEIQEENIPTQSHYTVAVADLDEVKNKLDKLKSKASSYGVNFNYNISAPYPFTINLIDDYNKTSSKQRISAVDITVDIVSVKKGNYTVLAYIEHLPSGNIVTSLTNEEGIIDKSWYSIPAYCEHCHKNIGTRKYTFMVRNDDTDEILQIGKSCLKDYTGINPSSILLPFAIYSYESLKDEMSEDEFLGRFRTESLYDTSTILLYAYMTIKKFGYVKKDDYVNSTYKHVIDMTNNEVSVPDDIRSQANEMIEFIKSYDGTDEFIKMAQTLLDNNDTCRAKDIGRLCYVPQAYLNILSKLETKKQRELKFQKEAEQSQYLGQVGDKITVQISKAEVVYSFDYQISYYKSVINYIYKFTDINGNILTWTTSTDFDDDELNKINTLTGTIKELKDYKGIKQTVLTRCKVTFK